MNSVKWNIDNSWTLFLDRDGVINRKLEDDYVKSIDEFEFLPGILNSLKHLSIKFHKIVVVTNQQCIGKGIINENKLTEIHDYMISEIEKFGGRIDQIYVAPQLAKENSKYRKPNTGMALEAKEEFSSIDFNKSILVGDSVSDLEMGKRVGMKTVFISKNNSEYADVNLDSLTDFSNYLN